MSGTPMRPSSRRMEGSGSSARSASTTQDACFGQYDHLFGDIFERDNLDWQSREIATIAMLSTLRGAEPQLRAHMRIGMNVGLAPDQLQALVDVLARSVDNDSAQRARHELESQLAARSPR